MTNRAFGQTASAFHKECEFVLPSARGSTRPLWLDLETGRYFIDPDRDYVVQQPSALSHWVRNNGLDLFATVDRDEDYCLYPRYMSVVQIDGELWQRITPDEIASKLALHSIPRPTGEAILVRGHDKRTYLFQTNEGSLGILQIQRMDDPHPDLKIRYKLVESRREIGS